MYSKMHPPSSSCCLMTSRFCLTHREELADSCADAPIAAQSHQKRSFACLYAVLSSVS